jgi:HEAT repeat protein
MRSSFRLAAAIVPLLLAGCGEPATPDAGGETAQAPPGLDPYSALDQLNDPDPAVRARALKFLAAPRSAVGARELVTRYLRTDKPREKLAPLLDAWGAPAVEAFARDEQDLNTRARTFAAMKSEHAIGPLIGLLGAGDVAARAQAEEALLQQMNAVRPKLAAAVTQPDHFRPDARLGAALLLCRGEPMPLPEFCLGPLLGTGLDDLRDPAPVSAHPGAKAWLAGRGKDADARRAGDALVLLSAFGAETIDPLLAALRSDDLKLRTAAAAALSHLRDPRLVEPLVEQLLWAEDELRMQSEAEAMDAHFAERERMDREFGEAEEPDEEFADEELPDEPAYDRAALETLATVIARALGAQGALAVRPVLEAGSTLLPDRLQTILGAIPREELLPALIALLADPGDLGTYEVVEALARTGDPAAAAALLDALAAAPAGEPPLRGGELERLGAAAVDTCRTRLQHESAAVRAACIGLLGRVDAKAHADALLAALADPDPQVVAAAADGARFLDTAGAGDRLVPLLTHPDPGTRTAAARSLGGLRAAAAAPALVAAIGRLDFSPPEDEEAVAAEELGYSLPEDDEGDERLTPRPMNAGLEALAAIGAPAAAPILDALTAEPDVRIAVLLLYALAEIPAARDDPRTAAILVAAVDAKKRPYQAAGVHALGKLRPEGWLSALQSGFERERKNAAGMLGDYAVALAESRDGGAAQVLIAGLKTSLDEGQREIVIQSLGQNGSEPARVWLRQAFAEKDLAAVAAAHEYFIDLEAPGSEATLIAALEEWGHREMAVGMLNSGNDRLHWAARNWAEDNGYVVMQTFR